MEFLELAKQRYSVRNFTKDPISDAHMAKIREAAIVAPTGHNNQPVRVYILTSEGALEKVNAVSRCIFGAKTVLMIAYDNDKDWKNPLEEGVHSGQQDASIVATHIMMEVADLGIGTCWVNYFSNTELAKAFDLPENIIPVLLMPMGYPSDTAKPLAMHSAFPGADEMFTEL